MKVHLQKFNVEWISCATQITSTLTKLQNQSYRHYLTYQDTRSLFLANSWVTFTNIISRNMLSFSRFNSFRSGVVTIFLSSRLSHESNKAHREKYLILLMLCGNTWTWFDRKGMKNQIDKNVKKWWILNHSRGWRIIY